MPACASPEPADAASDVAPEAVAPEAVAPEAVAPEAVAPEATQAGDSRDDDVPSAAVPPEAPAPGRKGRRTRAWLPVSAVGLAVLLLAGSTGLLAWQLRQQSLAEDGRPEAMAAARDAARLLFSYDHQTLEKDFAAGLAVTTGEFREEYSRTTSEVVSPVAEKYDAVVVAEVVETAVVESRPGEVVTLVFLNQGTTSTRVKGQQVDQSRVRMHLVDRDGRWLVEAVEAL